MACAGYTAADGINCTASEKERQTGVQVYSGRRYKINTGR